jgi:hypothetical protein
LRLLGYGTKAAVSVERVRFEPPRVAIGGRVAMSFTLRGRSRTAQALLVDVSVHFVKGRGSSAKVFKVGRLQLPPGGTVDLKTTFSLAVHTTRVPRPGRHQVDVLLNGEARRVGSFEVVPARKAATGRSVRRRRTHPRWGSPGKRVEASPTSSRSTHSK